MIFAHIFSIFLALLPHLTSSKIMHKINYILIDCEIAFECHLIKYQNFNVIINQNIINFMNDFAACWLWWKYNKNAKIVCQNHPFRAWNIRYFIELNPSINIIFHSIILLSLYCLPFANNLWFVCGVATV